MGIASSGASQREIEDILEGIREIEAGQVVDYQTFMLQHPKSKTVKKGTSIEDHSWFMTT
jgi:hypothetical protein